MCRVKLPRPEIGIEDVLLLLSAGGEEGGDDVKSAWPSDTLGYTRVTMVGTMGCQRVSGS